MEEPFVVGHLALVKWHYLHLVVTILDSSREDTRYVSDDSRYQETNHEGSAELSSCQGDSHVSNCISQEEVEHELCFINRRKEVEELLFQKDVAFHILFIWLCCLLRVFDLTSIWPQGELLYGLERELIVPLNDMRSELVDIVKLVHVVYYLIVSIRPVVLVKEHAEYECLFSVLNGNKLELHSIGEAKVRLLLWSEEPLKLLLCLALSRHY